MPNLLGVQPSFATGFAQWPGQSEYPQLWEGLVAAYAPYLGMTGGKLIDWSGKGNTGVFGAGVASPIWVAGKFGSCLSFDGGDYVSLPKVIIANLNQYTVVVWFNYTSAATGILYSESQIASVVPRMFFAPYNAGFEFSHRDDANNEMTIEAGVAYNDGIWHQAVGVRYAANSWELFIDGVSKGTDSTNVGTTTTDVWDIGARHSTSDLFFTGKIDIPLIYNRALSQSERIQLYQEPTALVQLRRRAVTVSLPVVGVQDYTRGDVATMPADDIDLETEFADSDYDDVDTDDATRVSQGATGEFAAFLFKDKHTSQEQINVSWNGQSDRAPSDSTVYLQIYNRNTPAWENLDSESSENADTDFDLTGVVSSNLDEYFDANFWIACRVYQEAV